MPPKDRTAGLPEISNQGKQPKASATGVVGFIITDPFLPRHWSEDFQVQGGRGER